MAAGGSEGAGDRWFGTVRADKAALPVDRGTLGGMAPPAGGMGRSRFGWLRWSWARRPGWTGFRQAATLVGAVALGNVAVIHGTHLPERDLWAQLLQGVSCKAGYFSHLDGPVQLFRPVRADEGPQGLEEGQLPFVPTHLLGHLQKALKELHRVRLAWLLGQLRRGVEEGVGADC